VTEFNKIFLDRQQHQNV